MPLPPTVQPVTAVPENNWAKPNPGVSAGPSANEALVSATLAALAVEAKRAGWPAMAARRMVSHGVSLSSCFVGIPSPERGLWLLISAQTASCHLAGVYRCL